MGISPQDYERLQRRARQPEARSAQAMPVPAPRHDVLLGIDPSLRGTGYGVIRRNGRQATGLTHGSIRCPARWEHSRCLAAIAATLREVIARCQPTVAIVEGLFHAQNLQTALIMGQARGAAMAVIGEAGLVVHELSPRKVKQALVGYGAAQKSAVARMVQRHLELPDLPDPDAADALALALAFFHQQQGVGLTSLKRL